MLTPEKRAYLYSVYHDPSQPASFGGIDVLYKFAREHSTLGISRKDVHEFLRGQEVYSTHVKKNKSKAYYQLTTLGPHELIDVDTAYFDFNDHGGNSPKKIVVAIDTFSRRLAARSVKDIRSQTMRRVVPELVKELGGSRYIRHDSGTEFTSAAVQNALKRMKVKSLRSYAPNKSSAAERVIRSIKGRLYKYLQSTGSRDWSKALPSIVASYNNKKHRSLAGGKYSPNEVSDDNAAELWFYFKKQQLKHSAKPSPYKFALNDSVRVNQTRLAFDKDYLEQNSTVVYFISFRYLSGGNINRYRLKDEHNKEVGGSFTANQLEKCTITDDTEYRIEKELHYKDIEGVPCVYVKWFQMPSRYNSYVPLANVRQLSDNPSQPPARARATAARRRRRRN